MGLNKFEQVSICHWQEVPVQWGPMSRGWARARNVPVWWGPSWVMVPWDPQWTEWQLDMTKNITFWQLHLAGGKNKFSSHVKEWKGNLFCQKINSVRICQKIVNSRKTQSITLWKRNVLNLNLGWIFLYLRCITKSQEFSSSHLFVLLEYLE